MKIVLDSEQLKRMGSCSLLGLVRKESETTPNLPEYLEIVLPHKPQELSIPEYVLPCLIEDILFLTEHGVKVKVCCIFS